MFILIGSISGDLRAMRELNTLSSALVERGHSVAIFFTGDGVNHLRDGGLVGFSSKGVRLLACRTSMRERGVLPEGVLQEGVEMSSLSMLVELLEECDRAIFL